MNNKQILEEIYFYATSHDCEIKYITNDFTSKEAIDEIDKKIKEINKLGGTNKVVRIVIENNKFIYVQSDDNGDKAVYIINYNYHEKKSLIESLSVYCQANDLTYTKI